MRLIWFSKSIDPAFANQEITVAFPGSEMTTNALDVTLVSQFSVNRLDTFAQVINTWEGPISIVMLVMLEFTYNLYRNAYLTNAVDT